MEDGGGQRERQLVGEGEERGLCEAFSSWTV